MHARMAVVRGVENGFALARAASAGRLTLSDRYGRVVAEAVTSRARPVSLVGDVGLRSGGTVYAHYGDVFAFVVLTFATTLVLFASRGAASDRTRTQPRGRPAAWSETCRSGRATSESGVLCRLHEE
jgi:apolipoprotein N-acyltransferase